MQIKKLFLLTNCIKDKTVTMHQRNLQILAKNKISLKIKTEVSNFIEILQYVI